jgi:hypothetical protein
VSWLDYSVANPVIKGIKVGNESSKECNVRFLCLDSGFVFGEFLILGVARPLACVVLGGVMIGSIS